ncbi:MAG: hypothetical protein ACXQS8_01535, partial [Candidatus Helarchaeales archaeon]
AIQFLIKFYEQLAIEQVGNMLHEITEKIDKGLIKNRSDPLIKNLKQHYEYWKPIFQKYFPSAIPTILMKIRD